MESLTEPPLESSTMVAPAAGAPREFLELPRAIRCDDADRRDPAPAIGLARIPLEMHRLLAFFEGAAGVCRVAQRRDRARQCETKGQWRRGAPSREISATPQTSIWFLPPSPPKNSGNGFSLAQDDSVIDP
jgi:hypothetical protein